MIRSLISPDADRVIMEASTARIRGALGCSSEGETLAPQNWQDTFTSRGNGTLKFLTRWLDTLSRGCAKGGVIDMETRDRAAPAIVDVSTAIVWPGEGEGQTIDDLQDRDCADELRCGRVTRDGTDTVEATIYRRRRIPFPQDAFDPAESGDAQDWPPGIFPPYSDWDA